MARPYVIYIFILMTKLGSQWQKVKIVGLFGSIALLAITAFAHPENRASNRVLLSQGFERTGFHEAMNRNMYQFRIG